MDDPTKSGPKGVNWIAIRTAFVVKGWSAQKCADEFGLNPTTIKLRAAKEGWTAERTRIATASADSVAIEIGKATQEQLRIHAERAESRNSLGDRLQVLIEKLITQAEANPTAPLVRAASESYEKLMSGHAKGVQVDRIVRALDDETPSDGGTIAEAEQPGKRYEVVVEEVAESA